MGEPIRGSFAEAAARGIYLDLQCRCGRSGPVSARSLCERGWGGYQLVGSQERFRCTSCGRKGLSFSIHGYWVGNGDTPAGWTESVEERMAREAGPIPLR